MRKYLCGVFPGILLCLPHGAAFAADASEQKAILVTGGSTGIGRNLAETLAASEH
jgi:hypothetical protein